MSLNRLFKAAIPMALVCGPLLSQDVFEFHGYMRAGAGRSSNGGEQVNFYMPGCSNDPSAGPGYRLGNEIDNYIELAMDVRAYDKAGTTFKLHFRPTFRQFNDARDASADAGGNVDYSHQAGQNQSVYLREAYGEATGIFGKTGPLAEASLWAGRRFYQRHDLHILDLFYWNNSGDGAGIEGINVGLGKFHYAYVQHDRNNVDGGWNGGVNGWAHFPGTVNSDAFNFNGKVIVASHDLRWTDIPLWTNGSLQVGFQYNEPHIRKDALAPGNHNVGRQFRLEWQQSGILGGDNKLYYTKGDGSTFWGWYNPEVSTKANWWMIMDTLFIQPSPQFGMQAVILKRVQHEDPTQPGARDLVWTSMGARPTWFFSKHMSLAAEIGADRFNVTGDARTRTMIKKTLALQFSPQSSFWSRPVIRFFVTKANWNKEATNWGTPSGLGTFGAAQTGTTFGAQVEAWW